MCMAERQISLLCGFLTQTIHRLSHNIYSSVEQTPTKRKLEQPQQYTNSTKRTIIYVSKHNDAI